MGRPSLFDRALGFAFPSLAARRRAAQFALDGLRSEAFGYDGARRDPADRWLPVQSGPNSLGAYDGARVRAAARDAVRNNSLARRAVSLLPAYIIGKGFWPMLPEGSVAKDALESAWKRFLKRCDLDRVFGFNQIARDTVRSAIEGGYAFLEYRPTPDPQRPLEVVPLEADYLDVAKVQPADEAGSYIWHGLEFDRDHRVTAFWLFVHHPGEHLVAVNLYALSRRVPVENCDLIAFPRRLGERLPVSWLAPAIETLRDRKDYLTSERVRAKVQACLALIIKGARPGAVSSLGRPQGGGSGAGMSGNEPLVDGYGNAIDGMRPGMIAYSGHATEITGFEPKGVAAQKDFVSIADHDIAAAVDTPHFLLTGDLSGVNFSSARMGLLQFRQQLDEWQEQVEALIYARAWRRVVEAEQRLGRVAADTVEPTWSRPVLYSADQVKDAQAKGMRAAQGLESLIEQILAEGRDPDAVLDAEVDWQRKRQARGLPTAIAPAAGAVDAAGGGEAGAAPAASGNEDDDGQAADGGAADEIDFNALGIGVRSGFITPDADLEAVARTAAGLPPMSALVSEAWEVEPVRRPVTLSAPISDGHSAEAAAEDQSDDGDAAEDA